MAEVALPVAGSLISEWATFAQACFLCLKRRGGIICFVFVVLVAEIASGEITSVFFVLFLRGSYRLEKKKKALQIYL